MLLPIAEQRLARCRARCAAVASRRSFQTPASGGQLRTRNPAMPDISAQLAQQKLVPSCSTPWPTMRQPLSREGAVEIVMVK
ncbi:hypothetical protein AYO44_17150 [Planctomycetaceae bacterium SCGC AG-212-F19]|nr:hypothetical protein AYO44_17150 [Planctomycetaceae bacterium SCGC AG-212-F19]